MSLPTFPCNVFNRISRFRTVESPTGIATAGPEASPLAWSKNCTRTLPRFSGIESISCCCRAFSEASSLWRLLGGGTSVAIVSKPALSQPCNACCDDDVGFHSFFQKIPIHIDTLIRFCKSLSYEHVTPWRILHNLVYISPLGKQPQVDLDLARRRCFLSRRNYVDENRRDLK